MSAIKMTPVIEQYFDFMATKLRVIFLHNSTDELRALLLEEVQRIYEFGARAQLSACKAALDKYCMQIERSGEEFSLPAALAALPTARPGEHV